MDSTLLPDTVRTKALIERIAEEREWSSENIENDVAILEKNRLVYVRDLRSLSKESWAVIELLPIVKDLLRNAIDPEWASKYDEHEQKSIGGKKNANGKKKNKNKGQDSSDDDDDDDDDDDNNNKNKNNKKKKDKKDKKDKKEKKEKKKKGFVSASPLGTPVVPTILTRPSEIEPVTQVEDIPAPDTLGEILSDDHLTIQNTIRNGSNDYDNASSISSNNSSSSSSSNEEELTSPISPNGTRRKSVTFSNETAVGVAASEKTNSITTNSVINVDKEKKKDKKKDKEKKKEKKKDKENNSNNKMASMNNINGVHHSFTNLHHHPLVKFKKISKKHCRNLPPVPANDLFLQNLYKKLITASGQSI